MPGIGWTTVRLYHVLLQYSTFFVMPQKDEGFEVSLKNEQNRKAAQFEHLWDRQGNGNVLEKAEVEKNL